MSLISTYSLNLDWSRVDNELLLELEKFKSSKCRADLKSILALRKYIFRTLCPSYQVYSNNHPEAKKYPGRGVYRDLSTQVLRKYPHIFQTTVRKKVVDNGHEWFALKLEQSVLNKMKGTNRRPQDESSDDNDDEWDEGALLREDQEEMKKELQDAFQSEWEDVQCQMADTFELRREDIRKLKRSEGWQNKIKEEWPWLCCAEGMNQHSNLVLGHDLDIAYSKFKDQELEDFLNYAVTSTSSNVKNLAVRLKYDDNEDMAMLLIVGNLFKEDTYKLVISEDQSDNDLTDSSDEESNGWGSLDLPASPCIVQQGSTKFIISISKYPLVTTNSTADALITLFGCCHALNLAYPPFPLSLEFFERYVFEIPMAKTKILKKGRQVQCMSTAVMKITNKIDEFKSKLEAELNQD